MSQSNPVKLFISYSHKDEAYKNRFDIALRPLKRLKLIDVWQDEHVLPGEEFEKSIFDEIEKAEVICLLVSPSFIDSDYCFTQEMEEALKKQKMGGVSVVPILLRSTPLWHKFDIGKLKALPKDGKPVDDWDNADVAWTDVVTRISELVDFIHKKPNRYAVASGQQPPVDTATPSDTTASPSTPQTLSATLRNRLAHGDVKGVINELIILTSQNSHREQNSAVMLSTRWNALTSKEASGTIGESSAALERNKIVESILYIIGQIEGNS